MTFKPFKYQVVGLEDGVFETQDVSQFIEYLGVRGFKYSGMTKSNPYVHAWLIGQPTFSGLMGPMGGRTHNGVHCVRYSVFCHD